MEDLFEVVLLEVEVLNSVLECDIILLLLFVQLMIPIEPLLVTELSSLLVVLQVP